MSPRHFTKFLYGPYFIQDHVQNVPEHKNKIVLFFKKIKKIFKKNTAN